MLLAVGALAQRGANPKTIVAQHNKKAMDAYANLKLKAAFKSLETALSVCKKHNLKGEPLARTFLNFGVIEAGGNQDNAAAMGYFKKALCEDQNILLDPLSSSPDIETLFNIAKQQVKSPGGCAGISSDPTPVPTGLPPGPSPALPPVGVPPAGPAPVEQTGLMRHQPVTQQVRLSPVPIYVEVNPSVEVGQVILYYRTLGERIFQQVPMTPRFNGYAATIGCDVMQTFDPSGIEYYVGVLNEDEQLLGTVGSEAQPYTVAIVDTLSVPPPSIPNEAPPARCIEECPPWNPDCNKTCKMFGDLCDSSSECCSGMVCVEETCKPSEGGGSDRLFVEDYKPVMRLGLSFGSGYGLLLGSQVDPYNQTSKTPFHVLSMAPRKNEGNVVTDTGFAWNKFNFRAAALFYLSPGFAMGISFRGGLAFDQSGASEVMPLAPTGLANVAFRIVGHGSKTFELTGLIGVGGGVIQYRVPYEDCAEFIIHDPNSPESSQQNVNPWVDPRKLNQVQTGCNWKAIDSYQRWKEDGYDDIWYGTNAWDKSTDRIIKVYFQEAGKLVGEIGLNSYVWIVKNFGLNLGVFADAYFLPDFALNFDLQFGPAFRF
ncbi:MAG: hypothetical protein QNJ97_08990 [Myxococcota bacterium]|nr:hypothetical protein [Myxococcota bacterium]